MNIDSVEILIVEDNPTDAELTIRALKRHGLANDFYLVTDGEQALDFIFKRGGFSGRKPHVALKVVFLDLKLPKVSGLEVLTAIRGNADTRSLPVVVVSSSNEFSDINTAYHLGVNSYVVKPVDFDEYVNCISSSGHYWLRLNEIPDR